VGIHLGAEIGFNNSSIKLNGTNVVTPNLTDSEGDRFDMHTALSKYKETQNTMFLNIPIMLQVQVGVKHKFYAMGGIKLGIPVSCKYKVSEFTLTNKAYYPEYDNWMTAPEFAGYGTFTNRESNGKLPLKVSGTLALEAGMKWKIAEVFAIYTGLYLDYGLNNMLKNNNFVNYSSAHPAEFTTTSALPSLTDKINLLAVGVKARFTFIK
jgi:hypothetical protein